MHKIIFPFLLLCFSDLANCQITLENSAELNARLTKIYKKSDIAGFVFASNSDYEDGDPNGKLQKQLQDILGAAKAFETR